MEWVATVLTILGYYLICKKNPRGFVLSIIAGVFWIAYGFQISSWAIIIVNTIFIGISASAHIQWVADFHRRSNK